MIRVAFLLCLSALPLQAQDFRGLLPGMPTQELARLGEPLDLRNQHGLTTAIYPLPFERTLGVMHAGGQIVAMTLAAYPHTSLRPPASDGLQVGETSLSEAISLVGSDGYAFEATGLWDGFPPVGCFLPYTLVDHPELVLVLSFFGRSNPSRDDDDIDSVADMPQDATLFSATLYDPSSIAGFPILAEMQQAPPPPDAMPLAVSLTDAFPLIELPQ